MFCCICAYFQTTRIKFFKTIFFNVWSGKKRALVHLRILSDHQKHGLKLMLYNVCCGNVRVLMHLCILRDHQNQIFLKSIFFTVQTTRIKFLKKKFFNVWSGWKRVLLHLRILPWCYLTSEVVIYMFWRICTYFQTTRIKFLKKIFFNVWSG